MRYILSTIFSYVLFQILFIYILFYNSIKNIFIIVALFSCDRSQLLNKTIINFYYHMFNYEKNIHFTLYLLDSGTINRKIFVLAYHIKNYFFMNPNDPEYSYGVFYSYMYGNYVLFLEDDRPFILDIERKIIYPNFIEEAIILLTNLKDIKGIILKGTSFGRVKKMSIKTILGKSIFCVIDFPAYGYYYTNGPAVYKVKALLSSENFISEAHMANFFKKKKWFTGFTYKGISCKGNETFTSSCQTVSNHIGNSSTQKWKKEICKISLY